VREFLILIGELALLYAFQEFIEMFLRLEEKPMQKRMLNVAFLAGYLCLILQYISSDTLKAFFDLVGTITSNVE